MMDLPEIKQHWVNCALSEETDLKATTKTPTIKRLEVQALHSAIKKTGISQGKPSHILEVGCGNGYNCLALSELLPYVKFLGVDYVPLMVKNAKKLKFANPKKYTNVEFCIVDVLHLDEAPAVDGEYPIVFTDRCLINLNKIDLQLKAFDQLSKKVQAGGYFIMIENTLQNYEKQNNCREAVGLPRRKPSQHNLFIDEDVFLRHAKKTMDLVYIDDFGSLHDIVLYILIPMMNKGQIDYNHPLLQAATELSLSMSHQRDDLFGRLGQNRLFLFQKVR